MIFLVVGEGEPVQIYHLLGFMMAAPRLVALPIPEPVLTYNRKITGLLREGQGLIAGCTADLEVLQE